jgi:hypothetical protein
MRPEFSEGPVVILASGLPALFPRFIRQFLNLRFAVFGVWNIADESLASVNGEQGGMVR